MAFWIWVVVAVLIVLIGLLVMALVSRIQLRVRYSRSGMVDRAALVVQALYGAFRYRLEIPYPAAQAWNKALQNRQSGSKSGLLKKTKEFRPWMFQTLKKVECTRYRMDLRVGTGDAASTAIVTGLLWTLYGCAVAVTGQLVTLKTDPHGGVAPNYDAEELTLVWEADFRIRLGAVVWAVLKLGKRMFRLRETLLSGGNRVTGPQPA